VPALFTLEDVTVARGAGEEQTYPLQSASATIRDGVCTVVVGPSGAGKTTLLRLLNRFEDPSSGRLCYREQRIDEYDVLELRRRVGLLQQQPVILGATVRDDVATARDLSTDEVADLLARAGLSPDFAGRATDSLSGGEAQRVCLARALSVAPDVLLADEPTAALDAAAAGTVERTLRGLIDNGLTSVVVTHDLAQARRLGDDAIVLVGGAIVATGPAAQVLSAPADPRASAFLESAARAS
jgi:putative ABC transport system ATP-binding protein